MITLIDHYGSDHGLSVHVSERTVTVSQWGQLCEPDEEGNVRPHLQHGSLSLADAWTLAGDRRFESTSKRVIQGALEYLGRYGGESEALSEDATPAEYFMTPVGPAEFNRSALKGLLAQKRLVLEQLQIEIETLELRLTPEQDEPCFQAVCSRGYLDLTPSTGEPIGPLEPSFEAAYQAALGRISWLTNGCFGVYDVRSRQFWGVSDQDYEDAQNASYQAAHDPNRTVWG